jgi:glutaredoxin
VKLTIKIFMYALSTCPCCRKTKQFFRDRNIPFKYVDHDLVGEKEQKKILEKMSRYGGSTAFPFVKIDGEAVIGYNPRNMLSY